MKLSEVGEDKPKTLRLSQISVEDKPESGPVLGSPIAEQIPTGGYRKAPPLTELAGEPKFAEKASMYATAVPAAGLASQALKLGTMGTRAAPYTSLLAEALTPKTGRALATTMGLAGATAVPAEYARYKVEEAGGSPVAQELTELGVGGVFGGDLGNSVGIIGTVSSVI